MLHSPLHSNKQLWKVYVATNPVACYQLVQSVWEDRFSGSMLSVGTISLEDRFSSSMSSVGTISLEDRFSGSKKGGIGGGGRVSAQDAMHMKAALAGCRTALVGTGWTISAQMGTDKGGTKPLTSPPHTHTIKTRPPHNQSWS